MMRRIGSSTSASKVKELEVNALLDTLNEVRASILTDDAAYTEGAVVRRSHGSECFHSILR